MLAPERHNADCWAMTSESSAICVKNIRGTAWVHYVSARIAFSKRKCVAPAPVGDGTVGGVTTHRHHVMGAPMSTSTPRRLSGIERPATDQGTYSAITGQDGGKHGGCEGQDEAAAQRPREDDACALTRELLLHHDRVQCGGGCRRNKPASPS